MHGQIVYMCSDDGVMLMPRVMSSVQDFNDCRAVFDVRDVVDKLKIKAVSKTREFILQKIYLFRKPMANYQVLQNQLLNYR